MRLAAWLTDSGTARNEFARKIGVTPGYVTQLCDGVVWPSRKVVEEIQRVTAGKVTANDFVMSAA